MALLAIGSLPVTSSAIAAQAATAEAGTAAPSLGKLPATSAAGKQLTLAGHAGRRTPVSVQRRYGKGSWVTVTRVTSSGNGAWSTKVKLTQGGPTSFRAEVGRKASQVRTLAVYQWLAVDTQSTYVDSAMTNHRTATIAGHRYPDSYQLVGQAPGASSDHIVAVESDAHCTLAQAWAGVVDSEDAADGPAASISLSLQGFASGTTPDTAAATGTTTPGQVAEVTLKVPSSTFVAFGFTATPDPDKDTTPLPVLASARVYCDVAALGPFAVTVG